MTASASTKVRGQTKPRRPKHVPQRMCVACRDHTAKRALIRVVRTVDGTVEIDPTGRKNGRGAYLCGQATCWERALKTGVLARALNAELTTETIEQLRCHAASLAPRVAESGAAMTREENPL